DYIYIPLGGNRKGEFRTYTNLLATFLIGGLWHGAGWTFIIWGALHGIALAIHRFWQSLGFKMNKILAWFITFNFINITWIFFRAKDFESAMKVLGSMFSLDNVVLNKKLIFVDIGAKFNDIVIWTIVVFIIVLGFKNAMYKFYINDFRLTNKNTYIYSILMALLFLIALFKGSIQEYSEFIYFNF
ncbi:MBOAT family O-acyltransferase, partial [Aliarcobacter cryaerophilus]|uniref:MBOAT family O-acyltransferase n=1 Tax=Aliarcobacter cryaerophilus TaxID=28198 RepID=UPI003DA2D742